MSASDLSARFVGAVCRRGLSACFAGGGLSVAAGILFLTGKKFSARCVKEWRTVAFKHLDSRQVTDAQWDHVESLGVRDSYDGSLFDRSWEEMTVDEKHGYCLVMRGKTCPRGLFEDGSDREIYFYALCLNDNVFYFDVEKEFKGKIAENNFEHYWHIVRIEFPDGWSFDSISVDEFKQIVIEAFTAETYKIYTPDKVKKITVDFPENFVDKICDREKRNKDDKK